MRTFLSDVANDMIRKYGTNLSRIAVVFPNKRASLFLNQYLAQAVDKPLWSPAYITISDLFRQHSTKTVGDPIKLICDLHKSFNEVTLLDEKLDRFYGWGELLLADFDDIDKNMGDSRLIFSNLKDIHEMDSLDYLTEEQRMALRRFFNNFQDDQDSELKRRFLNLWSHLEAIYQDFKERLTKQNIAYEGMLYREIVEQQKLDFKYETYIFVGFNMMQKVELLLCDRLKEQGKAKFYWDFDDFYMPHENEVEKEAGHYIASYLKYYPNEFDNTDTLLYHHMSAPKDISFVSAATENIQARYVSSWLKQRKRMQDGAKTAVILCNESLLPTVIHSLPPTYQDNGEKKLQVNVTTGYPLQQSPVSTFVKLLFSLQTEGFKAEAGKFRWHWVKKVLGHPYSSFLSASLQEAVFQLKNSHRVLLSEKELALDDGLALLFRHAEGNRAICQWACEVLRSVGIHSSQQAEWTQAATDPLFQESLFRMYTLLNRLLGLIDSGDLVVDVATLQKLIQQLIASTSIPFHGEPIIGVQIMGVLETRNLDFDHLLILSCNEGNMPKGVNDASFIPYSIRKVNQLTTIDHKVNIYAYYFYRLIQRAKDVTILYNNAVNDGQTGEMSRFMLQLMVESRHAIRRLNLNAGQVPLTVASTSIPKDENVMHILDGLTRISPSALGTYLRCQLRFYFQYIAGIKQSDREDEGIDNRIFGNIFHRVAELFYQPYAERQTSIHAEDLRQAKENTIALNQLVDRAFKEELFKTAIQEKVEYNGLELINRQVILSYFKNLIELDIRKAPFNVLGTELDIDKWVETETDDGPKKIQLCGKIDRLDFKPGQGLQVIDYKTGWAGHAGGINGVEDIFVPKNIDKHSDYYLQAMLYSVMVKEKHDLNPDNAPVSPSLLFIQNSFNKDYKATLALGKEEITDIAAFRDEFMGHLSALMADILNPSKPFEPTAETGRCANCPYRQICKSSEK